MAAVGRRFRDALVWAAELHEDQSRKGGDVPYVAHLLGVAAIVLEHGGDEDTAIAALLHDALEDQAHKITEGGIRERFGEAVERIVIECCDGTPEEQRDKSHARWYARKKNYIAAIAHKSDGALMVSMADKLYNVRSMLEDYRVEGEALWSRFTTGREGNLWYYDAMVAAYEQRVGRTRLWGELARTVAEFKNLEAAGDRR
ncbi:MAG: bifunctional (p)ppGpp synthetase/guanosine-3',5'-bis(diphosphate) 3'-pyrophosphohydrolase [Betaproteobacteria bacterium]|nr:bifunctional (p)ppGpp synthetase/guanosine-3',5'-bis(diphosphate) 3'-pyrophosphohydrolase [Betaproteobacteria bacterium]